MEGFNMNYGKYEPLVKDLETKGVNFSFDAFNRNTRENSEINWNDLAAAYGYRKPKNGYFSKGGHFYLLLQKVYKKMHETK